MTPEQKARVLIQLIESRYSAAELASYHEREALRYRLHYKNLGDAINTVLSSETKRGLTKKK